MSIQINHEKVAKKLALKIADLEYQVTAYDTIVEDLQSQISQLNDTIKTLEKGPQDDDNVSTV